MIEAGKFENVEETISEEDRISELPEDLLVMILGLVPTKDAVATMFLSKRWLSIWTMVRRLEYEDIDADDDDEYYWFKEENIKSVWKFLDKSIQLHKAPVIDYLSVKLGRLCPIDVDVGKLIANALSRCLRELEFTLLWSSDPTALPKSLYSCESLVNLTISHKILVDVPSSAFLPSLEKLNLNYVVYKDDDSLGRLLSSCPILKWLKVKRRKDDNVKKFTLKVPSLLELSYYNFLDVEEDNDKLLVIDIPTLENFTIFDYPGDSWLIENMPFLKDACIAVKSYPNEKSFLSFLSSVSSLELCLPNSLVLACCSTINFSQLIKLTICPRDSDWLESLIILLGNSPKLKNLLVNSDFTLYMDVTLSWNQPSCSVPECLSSQLEVFEWKDYAGKEEEEQFLIYILANCKCLKTATFSLTSMFSLEESYMNMMIDKLKSIPRVSTTSQILFKP